MLLAQAQLFRYFSGFWYFSGFRLNLSGLSLIFSGFWRRNLSCFPRFFDAGATFLWFVIYEKSKI
jgi:hypothetical protein